MLGRSTRDTTGADSSTKVTCPAPRDKASSPTAPDGWGVGVGKGCEGRGLGCRGKEMINGKQSSRLSIMIILQGERVHWLALVEGGCRYWINRKPLSLPAVAGGGNGLALARARLFFSIVPQLPIRCGPSITSLLLR